MYNYFSLEIIYYILEKKNLKFHSYIGLIYGRYHFLLLCESLKKVKNHVL
jgi:hypothetical protein